MDQNAIVVIYRMRFFACNIYCEERQDWTFT